MKNTLFFIFLLIMPFFSSSIKAQDTDVLISENFNNVGLDKALKKIQKNYNLELAFNSKIFRKYKVTIAFENVRAEKALNQMVGEHGYKVKFIGDVYVFSKIRKENNDIVGPSKLNFEWSSHVIDSETLEKLPYANLTILSTGESVQTDDGGYFYFYDLPSDTSKIMVSYVGYQITLLSLTPEMIENNEPVLLERNLNIISQVPVYGRKNPMLKVSTDDPLTEIDVKSARLFPDLGENDLLRMIQSQAGSNGTSERSGDLNIRGGESDETTIVFDGFNIYHVDHFYNLFSAINSNAVKHVRLHKGWFEPKFGGRTAGIIEITGKEGNENYKETQVDLNFTSASIFFENPLSDSKSTIAISARRSYTDVINSSLYRDLFNNIYNGSIRNNGQSVNTFDGSSEPEFSFSDINLKYTYRLNDNNKFNLSLYYGQDKLIISYTSQLPEFNQNSTFNDESQWGNIGFSGRWMKSWNRRFQTKLTLGQSRYQSDLFAVDFRENTLLQTSDTLNINRNNDLLDRTAVLDNEWYFKHHKISFGASAVINEIKFKQIDEEGIVTEDLESGILYAGYIQDNFDFKKFHFKGGVRLPYFSETGMVLEPRALVSYDIFEGLNIHASYGRNHQFIRRLSKQNLFLNTPDIWVLSDKTEIPVLRSDQITAGFTIESELLTIKAESYYRWYEGSIYDLSASPLYFPQQNSSISIGEKLVQGVDLTLLKSQGKHKGWASITIAEIVNRNHSIIPYDFTSDHDQLFEFKASYIYRIKGWSFSSQFVYGSGRPYTPSLGTYDLQLVNGTSQEILAYSNLNSGRLPEYHRLDLAITKHFLFSRSNQAEIGLSLFNVYDRININDVRYYYVNDGEGGGEVLQYNVEMLGFIPSLKLKYTF